MDVLRESEPLELPSIKRKSKLVAALPGVISSKFDTDLEIDQVHSYIVFTTKLLQLIAFLDKSTKQRKASQVQVI